MEPAARRARVPDAEIKPIFISEEDAGIAPRRASASSTRIREAAAALVQAAEAPSFRLPILPDAASEAMSLASDPNAPMNRLDRVVARDTVLAARMLAVASSSAYAGAPVRTLAAALQRLGTGAVRDVLYQSVMECHMFRGADERAARAQQEHALATARLAKAVCKVVGVDQSQAFIRGLLHDIGHLALQQLRTHPAWGPCTEAEREQVSGVVHTTLGARMGAKWKLPDIVVEAIRRHHRYRDWEPGAYSQIGHVVAVADAVAEDLGVGTAARALTQAELAAIGELGVEPGNLVEVARQAFAAGV